MKRLWLVASILCVLALMAACAPAPAGQAPAAAPAASSQPVYGGVLKYWLHVTPAGYDTHRKISYSPIIARPVFNNLITFDPNKSALVQANIVGDLAERWETSADGKVITFNLRKDVKWHDGTAFSADDVVYSLEKMMDSKRSRLYENFPTYQSVEKVDAYTVKLNLKTGSPSVLSMLAGPYASIQAKHKASVDFQSFDFLMGTGPFMFKEGKAGVTYELVRNPNYFKKNAAGKALPYLDGIVISIITDRGAQVDAFAAKRVDMGAPGFGITNQETLDRLKAVAPEAKLEFPPGGSNGSHTWFNLNYKPLSDLRVRKAIALVFDQEKLAIGGFGSTQFRNIQYGLFAPGYSIPPEEAQKILGWDKPWADRTAEARKLMAEAGYADGFKLQLVVQSTPEKEKYVTILADILRRELKIDTEIVVRIDAEAQKLRDAKQYGTYAQGMLALVGDPDEVVGYFRTGNPANFTGYSNPELDKLIDQQSTEMDVAKRKQLVNQMERLIWKDIPALPEGLNRLGSNYWPHVKNFIVHDASYSSNVMMERTWLQK